MGIFNINKEKQQARQERRNERNKIGTSFTVANDSLASEIDSAIENYSPYSSVLDTSATSGFQIKTVSDFTTPITASPLSITSPTNYSSVLDTSATSSYTPISATPFANQSKNSIFANATSSVSDKVGQAIGYIAPSPVMTADNRVRYGQKPWNETTPAFTLSTNNAITDSFDKKNNEITDALNKANSNTPEDTKTWEPNSGYITPTLEKNSPLLDSILSQKPQNCLLKNVKVEDAKSIYNNVSITSNGTKDADMSVVSQKSLNILKEAGNNAGIKNLTITSTIRIPAEQARIMFNNFEKNNFIRYTAPGEDIKALYLDLKKRGISGNQILESMENKIIEFGESDQRVSKHCVGSNTYNNTNVIDISTNNINGKAFVN